MNRRIVLLIALVVVVVAGIGTFMAKQKFEDRTRDHIHRFFAELPAPVTGSAKEVDVSFLDKSATLTGVIFTIPCEGGDVIISADRAHASGINLDAASKNAGTTQWAKKVDFKGLKIAGHGITMSLGDYRMEDIAGDMQQIGANGLALAAKLKALYDDDFDDMDEKDIVQLLDYYFVGLSSLSIGRADYTDFLLTVDQNLWNREFGEGPAPRMAVKSMASTGVNYGAFRDGAGVTTLVKMAELSGLDLSVLGLKATLGHYRVDNIAGDFDWIKKEIYALVPVFLSSQNAASYAERRSAERRLMVQLGSFMKAHENTTVGKLLIADFQFSLDIEGESIVGRLGKAEANDYSTLKAGPFDYSDMSMTVNGKPFFSWERISADGMTLPSLAKLYTVMGSADFSFNVIRDLLTELDFSVKNLKSKNLSFSDPVMGMGKVFNLGDVSFSYTGDKTHVMDFSFSGLDLEKKVLLRSGKLPPEVLAQLPETLSFTGGIRMTATAKSSLTFDIGLDRMSFGAKDLGEVALGVEVADYNLLSAAMGNFSGVTIGKATLELSDTGASEIIFGIMAEEEDMTIAEARSETIGELREKAEMIPTPLLQELATTFARFLEKPGQRFEVVMKPAAPMSASAIGTAAIMAPDQLGLSFSVAPVK